MHICGLRALYLLTFFSSVIREDLWVFLSFLSDRNIFSTIMMDSVGFFSRKVVRIRTNSRNSLYNAAAKKVSKIFTKTGEVYRNIHSGKSKSGSQMGAEGTCPQLATILQRNSPKINLNLFLIKLVRISGFSSLFSAIAIFSAHFAREC